MEGANWEVSGRNRPPTQLWQMDVLTRVRCSSTWRRWEEDAVAAGEDDVVAAERAESLDVRVAGFAAVSPAM